jgi:hypothetical protein
LFKIRTAKPVRQIPLNVHDHELLDHLINDDPLDTGHYLRGFNASKARKIACHACSNTKPGSDVAEKRTLQRMTKTATAVDRSNCRESLNFLYQTLQSAKKLEEETKSQNNDYRFYRILSSKIADLYNQINQFYKKLKK